MKIQVYHADVAVLSDKDLQVVADGIHWFGLAVSEPLFKKAAEDALKWAGANKTIRGIHIWLPKPLKVGHPEIKMINDALKSVGTNLVRFAPGEKDWEETLKVHYKDCIIQR